MPIMGDSRPALFHYNVGSICKWTMLHFSPICLNPEPLPHLLEALTRPGLWFKIQIVLLHFSMLTSIDTKCISWIEMECLSLFFIRRGDFNKLSVMLIKHKLRSCYHSANFMHKMLSETYFSLTFGSWKRKKTMCWCEEQSYSLVMSKMFSDVSHLKKIYIVICQCLLPS